MKSMEALLTRRHLLGVLGIGAMAGPMAAGADERSLDGLLGRRRMVRRFRADPVEDRVVQRILNAATRAPSAGHTEPWAFVVVRDPPRRAELGRAALGQMWLAEAPVVVVTCADLARSRARYDERGNRYGLIDTAFASLLLLLAVVEEGLGACFVGAFHDGEVTRLLHLPGHVQPVGIIPIGYPAEKPRTLKRRPLREMMHAERW